MVPHVESKRRRPRAAVDACRFQPLAAGDGRATQCTDARCEGMARRTHMEYQQDNFWIYVVQIESIPAMEKIE